MGRDISGAALLDPAKVVTQCDEGAKAYRAECIPGAAANAVYDRHAPHHGRRALQARPRCRSRRLPHGDRAGRRDADWPSDVVARGTRTRTAAPRPRATRGRPGASRARRPCRRAGDPSRRATRRAGRSAAHRPRGSRAARVRRRARAVRRALRSRGGRASRPATPRAGRPRRRASAASRKWLVCASSPSRGSTRATPCGESSKQAPPPPASTTVMQLEAEYGVSRSRPQASSTLPASSSRRRSTRCTGMPSSSAPSPAW